MASDPRYQAESIDFDPSSRQLCIIWSDGHRSVFPFIWLRHARIFPLMGRAEQLDQNNYQLPDDPVTMTIDSIRVDGEELIHLFALAMRHGISADQLGDEMFAFPTFAADIKSMM